jgi:hypothetical protein
VITSEKPKSSQTVEITFPKPKPAKENRVGMFLRFRPHFASCIKREAARKKMSQVAFVEACVALQCREAQPGLSFRFTLVKD